LVRVSAKPPILKAVRVQLGEGEACAHPKQYKKQRAPHDRASVAEALVNAESFGRNKPVIRFERKPV
jgi:hypothetical protein